MVISFIFIERNDYCCGPVMDWRPVQGVPRLSPDDRWDRLQPPRDPTDGLSGYRKWMDGWTIAAATKEKPALLSFHGCHYSNCLKWDQISVFLHKCEPLLQ